MKIVYLNASGQMGGAETSLLQLLASLRRARPTWDLHLVLGADGPLVGKSKAIGIACNVLLFPAELASFGDSNLSANSRKIQEFLFAVHRARSYASDLAYFLNELAPDLIHSTGFKMHLLSVWARPSQVPVIWHMHDYVSCRPLMSNLLKFHAGKCHSIIANSNSVREDITRAINPRSEVVTVYNAIDLDRFSPTGPTLDLDAVSGLPPAPPDTVKVGLIGTFAKWKGHKLFLRSLAKLPSRLPIRAYIVGGPIYQTTGSQYTLDELKSEAQKLGVSDRVGFTGFIHPSDSAIRSLDIIVHASTQPEPFGMTIVEAMACSRAVVASNLSGASELFFANDALSYTCGNVEELSESIRTLATNKDLRDRLGESARRSVTRFMHESRLTSELLSHYNRVCPAQLEPQVGIAS